MHEVYRELSWKWKTKGHFPLEASLQRTSARLCPFIHVHCMNCLSMPLGGQIWGLVSCIRHSRTYTCIHDEHDSEWYRWMDIIYQGSRIRRSTGTGDKRLAEAILRKVRSQIVEGVFFDKSPEQDRTFEDTMTRYMAERSVLKAPKSRIRDASALKHLLPVFGE